MNIYRTDHTSAIDSTCRCVSQFAGGPLDLEALGLSLLSLMVG